MRSITLSAPSRLHFGLFSVGQQVEWEYGGIGLIVQSPRTTVQVKHAATLTIRGSSADACRVAIHNWFVAQRADIVSSPLVPPTIDSIDDLPIEVIIQSQAPRHCGLGSGTQLALCVVVAIAKFLEVPLPGPVELATTVGRGKRSAIGSYGFFEGGFLVDRGKSPADLIAPLDFRTDFPTQWPVLIAIQRDCAGMSGSIESAAFGQLPDSTTVQREYLIELVRDQIIPGVLTGDYDQFAKAIYQFGRTSGMYFQSVQGGPYNGAAVSDLVTSIREFGLPAVGQTSWGPAVFAIAANSDHADEVSKQINRRFGEKFEIIITQADNQGVRVTAESTS